MASNHDGEGGVGCRVVSEEMKDEQELVIWVRVSGRGILGTMEMNEVTEANMKYSVPKKLEPYGVPALSGLVFF